jgi:hypothetical protein
VGKDFASFVAILDPHDRRSFQFFNTSYVFGDGDDGSGGDDDDDDTRIQWIQQQVMTVFRSTMVDAWRSHTNNIVYGSEEMDRLVAYRDDDRRHQALERQFVDHILDILPWPNYLQRNDTARDDEKDGTTETVVADVVDDDDDHHHHHQDHDLTWEDIEVVVVHRTPRVKHLLSIWHQRGETGETFRRFLLRSRDGGSLSYYYFSDSLGLALKFLKRNVRTTILNWIGISQSYRDTTNLCHIVACDVLRTNCTSPTYRDNNGTGVPVGPKVSRLARDAVHNDGGNGGGNVTMEDVSLRPKNQRNGRGNVDMDEAELQSIDDIMTEHDCRLKKYFLSKYQQRRRLLRILYEHDLFASCDHEDGQDGQGYGGDSPQRSFSRMVEQIQAVAATPSHPFADS